MQNKLSILFLLRKLQRNWGILLFLFSLSLIATFFNSRFSFLYGDFNPWSDINIYYTIGKGIFFDKIPYKDLFDHKGPVIFFIYYLGYALSPDSFQGMFFIQVIFLFLQIIYVYRIAYLFLPKNLSILACLIFCTLLYSFTKEGGSAEEFILVFIIISLFYFIKYFSINTVTHNPKIMFIHGILLSLVFYTKLNLILFWFFPLLSILIFLFYKKEYRNLITNAISLIISISIVSLIFVIYFYYNNALSDFNIAYFIINSKYGEVHSSDLYTRFLRGTYYLYLLAKAYTYTSIYILISICSLFLFIPKSKRIFLLALLLTFITQYYALVIGPKVFTYYFIIYLTFTPLGITFLLYDINYFFKRKKISNNIFCIIACIICVLLIVKHKNFYDYPFNDLVNKNLKKGESLNNIADYINASQDNEIICLGIHMGVDIFTLTKKTPNIKFFFTPNITPTKYPFLYQEQEDYIKNRLVKFAITYDYADNNNLFQRILEENNFKPVCKDSSGYVLYENTN